MNKNTVKTIIFNFASMLFFIAFAVAIFIFVSLIAPDKPMLFESIRIDGIESTIGGANEK